MMERKVVLKSKLKDWVSNPVAKLVVEALRRKCDECYTKRADHMIEGEPIKTQENRMFTLGQEGAYRDVWGMLELGEVELDDLFTAQNIEILEDIDEE